MEANNMKAMREIVSRRSIKIPIEIMPKCNAAALREALVKIREYIITGNTGYEPKELLELILNWCDSSLTKPPRNCDVGTAEEQAERYGLYCDKFTQDGMHCESCQCCGKIPFGKCEFAWAQMPYEEVKE